MSKNTAKNSARNMSLAPLPLVTSNVDDFVTKVRNEIKLDPELATSTAELAAKVVRFTSQFKDMSGAEKKEAAMEIFNKLSNDVAGVELSETLSDTIDVAVSLSKGKFDFNKISEIAEDFQDVAKSSCVKGGLNAVKKFLKL